MDLQIARLTHCLTDLILFGTQHIIWQCEVDDLQTIEIDVNMVEIH